MLLDREMQQIKQALQDLDNERQGMKGLLKNITPQGESLDRAGLYALLRKQSVIRRRISNLEIERGNKHQELKVCENEKKISMAHRKQFHRQNDKYKNLQERVKNEKRSALVRQEESENEEIIAWRK